MPTAIAPALAALLPVLVFLIALVGLDGYKLVRRRDVALLLGAGAAMAGLVLAFHRTLFPALDVSLVSYVRYVAPVVEEILKAAVIVYLLRRHRIGFLVDGTILAFAVGAGFALVENIWYLNAFADARFGIWLVRGFGTAIMHGAALVIFVLSALVFAERAERVARAAGPGRAQAGISYGPRGIALGLALAIALHSVYNHALGYPVLAMASIVLFAPPLIAVLFRRGEEGLRRWLGLGFDADAELLELIESGRVSESPVGVYLRSLSQTFQGPVVADMLCYIRLRTELALRAKGELLMRQHGFSTGFENEIENRFRELDFLERSLGPAGRRALRPILQHGSRELWQLRLLRPSRSS